MSVRPPVTFRLFCLESFFLRASHIAWADIIVLFRCRLVWTDEAVAAAHISPLLLACRCILTHASLSRVNSGNARPPGEPTPFRGTKRGLSEKILGGWRSRLASIRENNKQSRFLRAAGTDVFIYTEVCLKECMQPRMFQSEKHAGNSGVTKKYPLTLRCTWVAHNALSLSFSLSLSLSLYVPLSLSVSHT